jgi:5-methylcytosine-specific restriction endonuclease McrA
MLFQFDALSASIKGKRKPKVWMLQQAISTAARGIILPQGGLIAVSSIVYVINNTGHPLMPCTPAKARKLLRDRKAEVIDRCPFTIKLLWECEEHVQEVVLGIDKGSHSTGFCCVGNGNLLLSGVIQHRQDVKEKMENRRTNRRNRRGRKWYRPKRFLNRASSRRSGRLPPSSKTNVQEVIRVVEHIPLPISRIVVEEVQVDVARLNDPTLRGSRYQDPTRLDENLRIACLMRDSYQCQRCGKGKCRLEAHHLISREHRGKDTLPNLLTLCESCHHKVHQGAITLNLTGVSGHPDQIAQRTMQGKSYLYANLGAQGPLVTLFGSQTAALRKARGLPKAHDADALCIATYETGELVGYGREHFYRITFRPRRTRRQYHDLPRKGQGRVRYQVNEELGGFRKGDIVRVKGKYIKQINAIYSEGRLAFKRLKGEPPSALPNDCRLLERGRTVLWEKLPSDAMRGKA